MSSLSIPELQKRPWRADVFIEKVNKKEAFVKTDGNLVKLVMNLKGVKGLDKLLIELSKNMKGKSVMLKVLGSNKHIKLSDLKKTKEFGGGSAVKDSNSDKTTLQEVGFLVALDMLLQGVKRIDDYKPSKRMHVKAEISDVIQFLKENPDWMKSSIDGAKQIYSKFGATALRQHQFHHDSSTFNKIRKTGKELSGLSNADKWNPSDVYLIKNYQPDTTNIVAFNDYIDNELIGISLKKGEKEALHGSVAANVILKKFKLGSLSIKFKENDENFQKSVYNYLKEIQKNKFKEFYVHAPSNSIFESLKQMEINSVNFWKSMPTGIEFFSKVQNIEDVLKYGIMTAMSISPESCPHWKLEGGKLSKMPSGKHNIEIIRIRLKLNGSTDSVIDFKFNGTQMKCQLRSKSSLPQFIIIKTSENPSDLIKLSKMSK